MKYTFEVEISRKSAIRHISRYFAYLISLFILACVADISHKGWYFAIVMTIGVWIISIIREKIEHMINDFIDTMWGD